MHGCSNASQSDYVFFLLKVMFVCFLLFGCILMMLVSLCVSVRIDNARDIDYYCIYFLLSLFMFLYCRLIREFKHPGYVLYRWVKMQAIRYLWQIVILPFDWLSEPWWTWLSKLNIYQGSLPKAIGSNAEWIIEYDIIWSYHLLIGWNTRLILNKSF